MHSTVTFVTNQYSGDRIIKAAREIADLTNTTLVVVGIMDNQYKIDPNAVDYLFQQAKEYNASMNLIFREDSVAVMKEIINEYSTKCITTGMPSSNKSVLYKLWKDFPEKLFYTVDLDGSITEVSTAKVKSKTNI